jgi:hypothetical protein
MIFGASAHRSGGDLQRFTRCSAVRAAKQSFPFEVFDLLEPFSSGSRSERPSRSNRLR